MTKSELEDLLRRAGKIARDKDFFLIGSQALRAIAPAIPRDFPKTLEADLYPRRHPEAWGLLRTELGNQSKFFKQHGYYLDCTDPGLATLPDDWTERLIPFRTARTGGVTAWCLVRTIYSPASWLHGVRRIKNFSRRCCATNLLLQELYGNELMICRFQIHIGWNFLEHWINSWLNFGPKEIPS
jgi:hypothetical protein